jgi:hypothetical protein
MTARTHSPIVRIVPFLLAVCLFNLPAQARYSGGSGTADDPYQIANAADLIALGETPADYEKHFVLTADIDLDPNLPGGRVFDKAIIAPRSGNDIFSPPEPQFSGSFDGKGHTIKNLTISGGTSGFLGLFGRVWNGGRIRNVCLEGARITGAAGSPCLGSLVGANYDAIIDSCYAIARVVGGEGSGGVGGLVGHNQGTITYCYALGSVSVGKNSGSAGGLVGSSAGQITQCYASVAISSSGTSTWLGGLVGAAGGNSLSDCFWNVETSGLSESDSAVGLTTAQMRDPNTFMKAGWVFVNVSDGYSGTWAEPVGGGFPILWWQLPESQRPLLPSFAGGTGRPDDPYLIAMAGELNGIGSSSRLMKAHFKLIADIDLKDVALLTIGSEVFPFTGVFDGNGHTISNFTCISTDTEHAGLFAYIDGPKAEVKNLGLIAPHIDTQTAWCVGALAGRLDEGTIRNCYAQGGNVSGRSYRSGQEDKIYGGLSYTGGLIGISMGMVVDCRTTCSVFGSSRAGGLVGISDGTIINCTSSGAVSGNTYIGGLVGMNNDGEITGCSATGNVLAKGARAGGLAGDNTGRIINSYARGSVSGESIVGGLAGSNGYIQRRDIYYESPGEIINSYATGAVSGTSDVGGLVGRHEVGPVISSFWDIQTSGRTTSAAGVGKTTGQMGDIQTYLSAGWDLFGEIRNGTSEIWQMPQESGYPILAVSAGYTPPQLKGSGTPDHPYSISNEIELGAVVHYSPSAHYRLAASIDLSGVRWATAVVSRLDGTFDGNGHTISHLTIRGGSHLGLFGLVGSGAEVKNLGVLDVNVVGSSSYVGALAAVNGGSMMDCCSTGVVRSNGTGRSYCVGGLVASNSGAVAQCHSTALVNGTSSEAGGLAGDNVGSVTQCYSTGAVSTTAGDVGGLAGGNSGTVSECYSTGTVNSTSWSVGGLVGVNYRNGVVTQCYSTGRVSGTSEVGGLAGRNAATVSQCYSIGAVSGESNAGGLIGNGFFGSVTTSFWDTQTSGQAASDAGTGGTTAQMHTAQTFLDAGWDFVGETVNGTEDIWWIDEGKDYPRLWWER